MRSRVELTQHLLDHAARTLVENVANLTMEEALFLPPGGYRSILGTLKHAAGWSHVYHSFAFEPDPKRWEETDWPRRLRDTVDLSRGYLDEIIAWFGIAHERWMRSLGGVADEELDRPRPLHWGQRVPLFDIVVIVANHHLYHAGEINQLLSISRQEAWEETEEVEENHISTVGHRVRPPWME